MEIQYEAWLLKIKRNLLVSLCGILGGILMFLGNLTFIRFLLLLGGVVGSLVYYNSRYRDIFSIHKILSRN